MGQKEETDFRAQVTDIVAQAATMLTTVTKSHPDFHWAITGWWKSREDDTGNRVCSHSSSSMKDPDLLVKMLLNTAMVVYRSYFSDEMTIQKLNSMLYTSEKVGIEEVEHEECEEEIDGKQILEDILSAPVEEYADEVMCLMDAARPFMIAVENNPEHEFKFSNGASTISIAQNSVKGQQ